MDLIGTFSFALSGALHAARKRLDLFGIFITAFLTALGGGTTRDVLLGNTPVAWVRDLSYISLVLLAVIICTIAHKLLIKISQTLFLFDSIGIGVFTIENPDCTFFIDTRSHCRSDGCCNCCVWSILRMFSIEFL